MSSIRWDAEIAEVYDETYGAMFQAPALGPMIDLLAGLAGDGPALEFAIGTGRVALPLSARGSRCAASSCPRPWRNGYLPSRALAPYRSPSAT
jgi:hypothetical protein